MTSQITNISNTINDGNSVHFKFVFVLIEFFRKTMEIREFNLIPVHGVVREIAFY